MKIAIAQSAPSAIATALLVIPVADNGDKTPAPELLASDPALQALAAPLIAAADLTGKFVEPVWLLSPAGVSAQRILFLGAGKRDKFCLTELRKLAGAAARAAKSKNIKSFVLVLPELLEAPPPPRPPPKASSPATSTWTPTAATARISSSPT